MIITSIVVAATAAAVSSRFDSFSTIGGIIGSSVSAAFLILLGLMNGYILVKLIKQMQKVFSLPEGQEDEAWKIEGGGILFSILKKMFKLIDRYTRARYLTMNIVLTRNQTLEDVSSWHPVWTGIRYLVGNCIAGHLINRGCERDVFLGNFDSSSSVYWSVFAPRGLAIPMLTR